MSAREGCSTGSGSSSNSRRLLQHRVKCNCGNDAVIRTVMNGPNVGSKFYGCPLWPVSFVNFIAYFLFFSS
ncbi:DNA topoisomerase 3-alpha [Bienertia sinuspersici]